MGSAALTLALLGIEAALSLGVRAQTAPGQAPTLAAVDAATGIVHSQRLASGVPLGGIGTGTFQLMTDGTVSHATFNNNWNQPTGDLPGCFAAIWTHLGQRSDARVLALHNAYSLSAVSALDYDGLYPQATLTFPDPALPLTVTLRAFSPLIPFDILNSSFPAAAFLFEIKNTALVPVEVSIALSWENILGVGGTAEHGPFQHRDGDQVTRILDSEGFFGLKFTGPDLPAATTEENRLQANASGEYSLLAHPERPDAVVTTAGWNALDKRPAWWDQFARDGSVSGDAPRGQEDRSHPAGVVAVRLTLKPGGYAVLPFAFAWYMPHCWTSTGTDYGHFYQTAFPDSAQPARRLLTDWRTLLSLTEDWQQRLLFSNLPVWLVRRLINATAPLTTNSVTTRQGRFALLANAGMPEDTTSTSVHASSAFSAPGDRLVVNRLLLAFFPRLAAQQLADFAQMQSLSGAMPRSLGSLEAPQGWEEAPEVSAALPSPLDLIASLLRRLRFNWPDSPESASAFVLQMDEYVRWTGDRSFLALTYPQARLALRSVLQRDLDPDGLPSAALTTTLWDDDIPTTPSGSSPTSRPLRPAEATLWLAALHAGDDLAGQMEDRDFAQTCRQAAERTVAAIQKRFWNGQFYAENTGTSGTQIAKAPELCATDQLLGQWTADALGLDTGLPPGEIQAVLHSLQARNDKTKGAPFGPPWRVRADGTPSPQDPDALRCCLPASTLAQAVLYLLHGTPTEGVALLERLNTPRDDALKSPWQTPVYFRADTGRSESAGLASVTHAADWNALYALEGFTFNAEEAQMALDPQMPGTWRNLSAPLFAPTFWGNVEFKPTARGGVLTLRIDRLIPLASVTPNRPLRGSPDLILKTLRIPGPPPHSGPMGTEVPVVHTSLGRVPVGSHAVLEPTGSLLVTFDAPLTLLTGDRLEITVY